MAIVIVLILQVHKQVRGSGIVFLCLTDILCLTGAPLHLPVANSVPFSASPESLQSDRGHRVIVTKLCWESKSHQYQRLLEKAVF